MTLSMLFVLVLIIVAIFLFATEKLPVDLVALLVMSALLASGIITAQEGVAGFSNSATVTVGAMFVLSAGLFRTGAVNHLGTLVNAVARKSSFMGILTVMISVGFISAFINNTAAVAILLPVVVAMAKETGVAPSKLLMPLSFASMFGGACTLIGTSTNILVNSIVVEHGLEPLSMFEFTPFGLVVFVVGTLYMLLIGIPLIPSRSGENDLQGKFKLDAYLTELLVHPNCASVGKRLDEAPLISELDLAIIEITRDGEPLAELPSRETTILAGDVLHVRCSLEGIKKLQGRKDVSVSGTGKLSLDDMVTENTVLTECVVAPNSSIEGKTLKQLQFRDAYGAITLAIRHRDKVRREKLARTPLSAGDVLLMNVNRDRLEMLSQNFGLVLMNEITLPKFRRTKMVPALLIVFAVILLAALNIMPILVSAILGCVGMVLTRCITMEEAYEAIDWHVIFLLAGVLTLGVAMEKTGGAILISDLIINSLGGYGPHAVLGALFFASFSLTNIMSNNATAALLAPIAIATAQAMSVSPRPLIMGVTFAASLSFMTPVGYQTNTMIYGVGHFRFSDFLKVGTPLNLIFWVVATMVIPLVWPF